MRKYVNGQYLDITEEEIRQAEEEAKKHEIPRLPYAIRVSNRVHQRYTYDDEISIMRQKEEKPEEYAEWYAFCEECKRLERDEEE